MNSNIYNIALKHIGVGGKTSGVWNIEARFLSGIKDGSLKGSSVSNEKFTGQLKLMKDAIKNYSADLINSIEIYSKAQPKFCEIKKILCNKMRAAVKHFSLYKLA
ncbi:MAG: hypothetical protein LBJ32_01815 [Oscillospiraceae bacterium]|nr:hypothetical protein [Oscillospiraceae bacterium]